MIKRVIAVPLWFVSVWLMYGLVAYFLGVPDGGGAILGALTAALIALDPTGAFWGRPHVGIATKPATIGRGSAPETAR
jgi:hypothetical protein